MALTTPLPPPLVFDSIRKPLTPAKLSKWLLWSQSVSRVQPTGGQSALAPGVKSLGPCGLEAVFQFLCPQPLQLRGGEGLCAEDRLPV